MITAPPIEQVPRRIAITGNPNSGKSTIFNALTGMQQKVANYPGVTVERRAGRLRGRDDIEVIDLPGTYSLIARSLDEHVVCDVVLGLLDGGEVVDVFVIVIDANNLRRNLYFATQLIDLGLPVVMCCNMMDEVEAGGHQLDLAALSTELGVPVVGTIGNRRVGIDQLIRLIIDHDGRGGHTRRFEVPAAMDVEVRRLAEEVEAARLGRPGHECDLAAHLLAHAGASLDWARVSLPATLGSAVDAARARLTSAGCAQPHEVLAEARYATIERVVARVWRRGGRPRRSHRDRIDRVLTHPVIGLGIFGCLLFVMFLAIFSWATPFMDAIEAGLAWIGTTVGAWLPAGIVRSLLADGILGGVGAVVVFVPQICILFFCMGLLEDTGYMARAVMVMHRMMRAIGLPARSFIPLLSCFACAIPGIMAARTIENRRDRLVTILIAPLMTCSARIPVYVIIIGALFGSNVWLQAGIMLSLYLFGVATALLVAWVFKKTMLQGRRSLELLIELPPYRMPQWRVILRMMWERSVLFLRDAGTIIFVASVVLWALAYFPRRTVDGVPVAAEAGASYMGRMGRLIEPVIEPLGFDWKIGVGLIGSFAAREVFVSTMGVVYGVGGDVDEASETLRDKIASDRRPDGTRVFTPLVGISLMVFYALACQCVSTLGVIRRETAGWRWPVFVFVYMTALAYLGSLAVYQIGSAAGWGTA